ncbi:MAG TPA: DM13 domain-containing protein, partial [Solirubrobacteraceae bacterium]|nr:DM13 domain-containing protein [Solirubrobacteraceae bacterium]
TARIEQQVDVPLVEVPLPAMSAPGARSVLRGSFYRIDQVGRGRLTIYRLANGRYALRVADFYVTPNVDLEIRLSPLREPRTTREYLRAPARKIAPLNTTAGSMNFMLPAGVDPARYRSVVIWCPLITSAYAAATLERVNA